MADLKYHPSRHDHAGFLANAGQRPGFAEAYKALEPEYALASQMLKARAKAVPAPLAGLARRPASPRRHSR